MKFHRKTYNAIYTDTEENKTKIIKFLMDIRNDDVMDMGYYDSYDPENSLSCEIQIISKCDDNLFYTHKWEPNLRLLNWWCCKNSIPIFILDESREDENSDIINYLKTYVDYYDQES